MAFACRSCHGVPWHRHCHSRPLEVPVFKHPVKKDLLPFEDRVAMCKLAVSASHIGNLDNLEVVTLLTGQHVLPTQGSWLAGCGCVDILTLCDIFKRLSSMLPCCLWPVLTASRLIHDDDLGVSSVEQETGESNAGSLNSRYLVDISRCQTCCHTR